MSFKFTENLNLQFQGRVIYLLLAVPVVQLLFCLPFSFLSTFQYYSCGSSFLLILGAGYFMFLFFNIFDAVLLFFAYMLLALRPSLCTLPKHLLFGCSGPVGSPVLLPVSWGKLLVGKPCPPHIYSPTLQYAVIQFGGLVLSPVAPSS